MRPKDYLLQVSKAKEAIKQIQYEIEEANALSSGIGNMGFNSGSGSSNPNTKSPQEIQVFKLTDLIGDKMSLMIDYQRIDAIITNQIRGMDNKTYSSILHDRYIKEKRLEEIAVEKGYSYGYARQLHGLALQAFGEQYLDLEKRERPNTF